MMKSVYLVVCVSVFFPSMMLSQTALKWRTLTNAPHTGNSRHNDVWFINPKVGWVAGDGLFKTTDGGESWVTQWTAAGFRSIAFADSSRGWGGRIAGQRFFLGTTDGGTNWTDIPVVADSLGGICGIWVVDTSTVYAVGRVGGPARFYKTTDGGLTWTTRDMSTYATHLLDCFFLTRDSGFVAGGKGNLATVLFTHDGGVTWQSVYHGGTTNQHCWKLSFPNRRLGFGSLERLGGGGYFLKTTNGGLNWTQLQCYPDINQQGIGFATETLGWIGGWSNNSVETTDGGLTWHASEIGRNINRFRMFGDSLGYAVGQTVYKFTRDSTTLDVALQPQDHPSGFALGQNYPNPFNPTTVIDYLLRNPAHIDLSVYDVLGRKIRTLVHAFQPADNYMQTWDGTDNSGNQAAAGIYLYRLYTGNAVLVKKMSKLN